MIPWGNYQERAEIESVTPELAYAHLPARTECPVCGRDEFSGGAININCETCGGSGYVTTWRRSAVRVRAIWLDPASLKMIGGVVSSAELGDLLLVAKVQDKPVLEKVRDTAGAYLVVDGNQKVAVRSVVPNRVHGYTSLEVRCELVGKHDE